MPKKYSKKSKKGSKKSSPGFFSKKYSIGEMAAGAWKGVKFLKDLVNVEHKYFDVMQSNQAIGTTAVIYPLSQIAAGDAYNQRDGNSIKLESILLRLTAVLNTSAEQTFIRAILFFDDEQRGTTPTASEVLESSGDYLSPINHLNGLRFRVCRDKIINLRKTDNAQLVKMWCEPKRHIRYSSGTNTDTKEGNVYLLLLSDQATNTPLVDFDSRLRFIDN